MRKFVLVAALGLAACGPTEEPVVNTVPVENLTNAASGTSDADVVSKMDDGARRLTFARALTDADLPCDGVVKAEQVGTDRGLPLWRATCKNGTSYGITITPDGTANIIARRD